MPQHFHDTHTNGRISMYSGEARWEQIYYQQKKGFNAHTIAWNRGKATKVWIDEVPHAFGANTVLPIMLNQSFRFEDGTDIIGLQFDRNFYCLQNHDSEVGCYGFLFFGPQPTMFVHLQPDDQIRIEQLYQQFTEEFDNKEDIKAGMLRALLVNLVIQLTRIAKRQYIPTHPSQQSFELIRQYHFLVELHFKKEHQVQYYAAKLNKAPKTITNLFAIHGSKTPLQVIHERIVTEAKRLLLYTDRSVKEIANDLGFADHTHFSKFFKNQTGQSPTDFHKPVT
ncbi:MAG: helix-turn-helix domain-containing protein [Chitinophagaceae bacterium]